MSRTVTPPPPVKSSSAQTASVPHEMVAKRAYEKWCKRGQPCGTEKQDWYEAEAEIRGEMTRGAGATAHRK